MLRNVRKNILLKTGSVLKKKALQEESILPKIKIKTWSFDPSSIKSIENYEIKRSRIFIGHRKDKPLLVYCVQDPPIEKELIEKLEELAIELAYEQDVAKKLDHFLKERGLDNPDLRYILEREVNGYSSLDPLVNDPYLENIECIGAMKSVTVTHQQYGRLETNLIFEEEELDKLVQKLCNKAGKPISKTHPMIRNAMLPDGHRLACTFTTEVSPTSTFAIRKFPQKPWTITRLLVNGTIVSDIAAWLWLLIENKLSMLVAGEMGSGKTSLANALCGFCPPSSMIGTAEDIPEFRIPHKNWRRRYTRSSVTVEGGGAIPQSELVLQLLRENVDYVIVNEILGEEDAKIWIRAIETGHGGITTIHTESADVLIQRLIDLGIRKASLSSLHAVVFVAPFFVNENGIKKKTRKVTEVDDLFVEKDDVMFTKLFFYNPTEGTYNFVGVEELLNTNSAKIIMKKNGLTREELKAEYQKRKEYLEWLRKMALSSPNFFEVDRLIEEFSYFYSDPNYYKSITPIQPTISVKEQKVPSEESYVPYTPPIRVVEIKQVPKTVIRVVSASSTKGSEIKVIENEI